MAQILKQKLHNAHKVEGVKVHSIPFVPCSRIKTRERLNSIIPNKTSSVFLLQGKESSIEYAHDATEESEEERNFNDAGDSLAPVELPPCEIGRLAEACALITSCLQGPIL